MAKIKFENYNGLKNEINNPRGIAKKELKNGYAVVIKTNAKGEDEVDLATGDEEAKAIEWFVWNVIDTPELDNQGDFVIKEGAKVRAFKFQDGVEYDISGDLVEGTYADITVGKVLIPTTTGKYKVADLETGYKTALTVTQKINFGGQGFVVRKGSN